MIRVIVETIRTTRYGLVSFGVALVFALVVITMPQWATLSTIFGIDSYSFSEKVAVGTSLIVGSLTAQHSTLDIFALAVLALLTAVALALTLRDMHERIAVGRMTGLGLIGAFIGALGIGCSACGAAFLASIVGVSGAAWIVSTLPFHGVELTLGGIVLLLIAIYMLAKKLRAPRTCNTRKRKPDKM